MSVTQIPTLSVALSACVIGARIIRHRHQCRRHHAPRRRITPQIRNRRSNLHPEIAHAFPGLLIRFKHEAYVCRVQHTRQRIPRVSRLGPGDRWRDVDGFLIRVRVSGSGVGDKVGLICLGEGAEAGDQRGGGPVRQSSEVEVEIVERGQEVGGVQAGGHGVLEVVVLAIVSVGQVADVAVEGAVAEIGLEAVPLSCVVVYSAGHDGWVVSFDGGFDAFGVRRD